MIFGSYNLQARGIFDQNYFYATESNDIMASVCGICVYMHICVPICVHLNNCSKSTRPRDLLFLLKDTLSIEKL